MIDLIGFSTFLKIATVVVSLGVVSAPIVYPRYSLFTQRAGEGIEQLMQVRKEEEDIQICYLEKGEKGFKEVQMAADYAFGLDNQVECIYLAIGSPPDLGEYTGFGMEYGIGDNGVLYSESEGGEKVLLRWDGQDPSSTLRLEKLRGAVVMLAQQRSHYITMALAVLWATLSIVVVL